MLHLTPLAQAPCIPPARRVQDMNEADLFTQVLAWQFLIRSGRGGIVCIPGGAPGPLPNPPTICVTFCNRYLLNASISTRCWFSRICPIVSWGDWHAGWGFTTNRQSSHIPEAITCVGDFPTPPTKPSNCIYALCLSVI